MTRASPLTFWLCWGAGLILWIAALVIAAPWDLELSAAVSDHAALYGRVVADFGELPSWILVVSCLVLLAVCRHPDSRFYSLRPLAWAIIVLAIVHPLAITQSLKYFWGRIRFRDLGMDFAGFTSFYLPAGVGAGLSFPSGHVAMAAVFSPIPFYLVRTSRTTTGALAFVMVLLFVLAIAWGRIQAGAHYLTDCVFSIGLSLLLAAVVVRATGLRVHPSGDAHAEP